MYFRPGAIGAATPLDFLDISHSLWRWMPRKSEASKAQPKVSATAWFPGFHGSTLTPRIWSTRIWRKPRAGRIRAKSDFISSFRFFFRKHLETCRCSEARKAPFCPHGNQNPISLRASKNSSGPRIGSHRDTMRYLKVYKGFKGSTLHGNCRCS